MSPGYQESATSGRDATRYLAMATLKEREVLLNYEILGNQIILIIVVSLRALVTQNREYQECGSTAKPLVAKFQAYIRWKRKGAKNEVGS